MPCSAEELTYELWVQIMQRVPGRQHLSNCALVCRKLARAAEAAATSLRLYLYSRSVVRSQERHNGFLSWSSNHGSSLTKLHLTSHCSHDSIRQLACPNLLELHLTSCRVQLWAGRGHSGLLNSCTALARLKLSGCALQDDDAVMPAGGVPTTVAQLQHLDISSCRLPDKCRHLTSLTRLSLDSCWETSRLLQHISSVVRLERLYVQVYPRTSDYDLRGRKLQAFAKPIDASTLPGIEHLTALADLELSGCKLQPACLLPLTTRLTRLRLANIILKPLQVQPEDGALCASQLLQLLARLSALQQLTLRNINGEWPQQLSLYSALTASSKLERLVLDVGIKGAAWAHIFPVGRELPRLRFLAAFGTDATGEPFGPVTPADIMCLSSCCPGLQELSLTAPAAAASLALLQPLTTLTELGVYRIEPATAASLAALTQLQYLTLDACAPTAAAAAGQDAALGLYHLVPLTALMCLTRLDATRQGGTQFVAWELSLLNKAPAGSPPDVWVQLLERYAAEPTAQPAVISSVVQQLQQHAQELAAAGAEAAELRGRVQALEGHLQEVLAGLRQPLQQQQQV